jgi:putative flippase GtrA
MSPSLRRWIVFNSVGALGFAVQLAALTLLMGVLQWGYVPATALAVEMAVIHNFFWHERWTWADRADPGRLRIARRFLRFNLTNGAVSIAGNLILMRLFLHTFALHYLVANTLSIVVCAVLNFIASDRFVFRAISRNSALTFEGGASGGRLDEQKCTQNGDGHSDQQRGDHFVVADDGKAAEQQHGYETEIGAANPGGDAPAQYPQLGRIES